MVRLRAGVTIREEAIARAQKRLEAVALRTRSHRVSVGIHEGEGAKVDYHGNPSGAPLIQVAMAHEFGIGVPVRSFLRSWFDANRSRIERELTLAERSEFSGNTGAIDNLALRWQSELRQWIVSREANLQPLAKSTIEERERAGITQETPLFATGQLVDSIRAYVDGESK